MSKNSLWTVLDDGSAVVGVCDVSVMAPTFPKYKVNSYLTRSPAMGFSGALMPTASCGFKRLVEEVYATKALGSLPTGAIVVNYAPNPDASISGDIYSLKMQKWLAHCSNKAEVLDKISAGTLQLPIIPGKKVVKRRRLWAEVQELLNLGHDAVYTQAETTQGGFATLSVSAATSRGVVNAYLDKVQDKRFIIAPYVSNILAVVGVTFFHNGLLTAPIINIRLPKEVDEHGSTLGTCAPMSSAFRSKFEDELRLIEVYAQTAAKYLLTGIPEGDQLLSANVDFIIYEWQRERRIAFMEYNARLTHFTIISRALYRRLKVVGSEVPNYPQFAAKLSHGQTPYAVLGNDNIYVSPCVAQDFAGVMQVLKENGITIFSGQGVGILPVRDYFKDPKHPENPVVGFVFAARGSSSQLALQQVARLYIEVATFLGGGEDAYHREVDSLL